MRDPSVHIKRSDFLKILDELGLVDVGQRLDFADKFFICAVKYAVTNRHSNPKTKSTKEVKEKPVPTSEAELHFFIRSVYAHRAKEFHKSLKAPSKGTTEYTVLEKAASIAVEFSKNFCFSSVQEGMLRYIEIAFQLMGKKYRVQQLTYLRDSVYATQEALEKVLEDSNPEGTLALHNAYALFMSKEGISFDCRSNPEKYSNFLYARQEADTQAADYGDWMEAQFAGLAFARTFPEVYQLHGEKAVGRYHKFIFAKKKDTELFDADADIEFDSEEEREYYLKYLKK